MTKAERKKDWLNWFKMSVRQATEARLSGNIEHAVWLDGVVERYYKDNKKLGYYSEDILFEAESDIRND